MMMIKTQRRSQLGLKSSLIEPRGQLQSQRLNKVRKMAMTPKRKQRKEVMTRKQTKTTKTISKTSQIQRKKIRTKTIKRKRRSQTVL